MIYKASGLSTVPRRLLYKAMKIMKQINFENHTRHFLFVLKQLKVTNGGFATEAKHNHMDESSIF